MAERKDVVQTTSGTHKQHSGPVLAGTSRYLAQLLNAVPCGMKGETATAYLIMEHVVHQLRAGTAPTALEQHASHVLVGYEAPYAYQVLPTPGQSA